MSFIPSNNQVFARVYTAPGLVANIAGTVYDVPIANSAYVSTWRGDLVVEGSLFNQAGQETTSVRFMVTSDGAGQVEADIPNVTADGFLEDWILGVGISGGFLSLKFTVDINPSGDTYEYRYRVLSVNAN